MNRLGYFFGCLVLLSTVVVLVLSFAPFTPAVLAMPFLLLLSEVVALLGHWRLSIMSVHICLGTLLAVPGRRDYFPSLKTLNSSSL